MIYRDHGIVQIPSLKIVFEFHFKLNTLHLSQMNKFTWWFPFHFHLEFKFKEHFYRVYRAQRDILSIFLKKSFFAFKVFSEGEICDIWCTKWFDWKMSIQPPITVSNLKIKFLDSIEDKHSCFTSGQQFHFMVRVSFRSRIQI